MCQYVKDRWQLLALESQRPIKVADLYIKLISVVLWEPSPSTLVVAFVTLFRGELQKGGVPAAPSGTATLLRLSPSYSFYPRPLLSVADFRYPELPWLDGRCVQGPGTYSPRHG